MISDPIEFELFKNSLFSIADEMALTIFRTTYSGVLKDNMDYSTAMFDGSGKLAAQGLTLPGHLGSMPTAMAAIQEAFGDEHRREQMKQSANIFRVLIKTLQNAGIITDRTRAFYGM